MIGFSGIDSLTISTAGDRIVLWIPYEFFW